jgi:murein DD-endopeptidase MepM/ murein hydrolase activator NlpD
MRCAASPRSLSVSRTVLFITLAFAAVGCSADADRFRDAPRPAGRPAADLTGSATTAAQTLPPPTINAAALPPPPAQPLPAKTDVAPPAQRAPVTAATAADKPPAPSVSAAARPADNLRRHQVASGDTLRKIARQHNVSVAELAASNKITPQTKLKVGDELVIPPRTTTPAPQPTQKLASTTTAPAPSSNARKIVPAPEPTAENKDNASAALSFRWPVRGRIISGFGPKPGGQANAGINIAVPEGTPVKAAEEGVVVYANNELKSYGNLLLIRHADGYVTAYAHLSEILVKQGDTVKRGQVVAKSGQTGDVPSPQLHFEIRKKSTAVDPMPYLDRSASL